MKRIRYRGTSDSKVVRSSDFSAAGVAYGNTTFDRGNAFIQTVPEDVALFLLAQGDFVDADVSLDLEGYLRQLGTATEGVPVFVYGDSNSAADINNTNASTRWINRLNRRMGFVSLDNRAVAGHKIGDAAALAIGTTTPASTWAVNTKGLVICEIGTNDLMNADDALTRAAHANGLRALLAKLSAVTIKEQSDPAFTFSVAPAWDNLANANVISSGGSNAICSTEGAYVDMIIPTEADYWLLSMGTDGTTIRGGTITITQAGNQIGFLDLDGTTRATGNLGTLGSYSVAIPFHAVTGNVRATFSKAGRAGNVYGQVDALLRKSTTPPTIIIVKPVPLPNAPTHNKPALLTSLRATYDTIAAEFGSHVVVADPITAWDPATMIGGDNLHMKDNGHAYYAGEIQKVVSMLPFRAGMNVS